MAQYQTYEIYHMTYKCIDESLGIIDRIVIPIGRAKSPHNYIKAGKNGRKLMICARFHDLEEAATWLAKDIALREEEKKQGIRSKGPTVSLTSVGKWLNSQQGYRNSFRNYAVGNILSARRIIINPTTMDKLVVKAKDTIDKIKRGMSKFNPFSRANKYTNMTNPTMPKTTNAPLPGVK